MPGSHMIPTRESPGTISRRSFKPLAGEFRGEAGEAGDISPGTCQARDKARRDRIGAGGHYDRNRPRLSSDCRSRLVNGRHDQVYLQADQIGGEVGESLGLGVTKAALDEDVLPFHVPVLSQALVERLGDQAGSGQSAGIENANSGNLRRRLRIRRERVQKHGTRNAANELAPIGH